MSSFHRKQKNISKLSELDLETGASYETSWHYRYKDNNEIYVGGIAGELNEGDMIIVFSQYGEVTDITMPWNEQGDKHKGFCLLKYRDPRSCVLAIDNLNGIELNGRMLVVDHSEKEMEKEIEEKYGKTSIKRPS